MKNNVKWLIGVLALAVLIVGAAVLYDTFSGDFQQNLVVNPAVTEKETAAVTGPDAPAETTAPAETEEDDAFKAPDFTVYDGEGNEVRLSDMQGKPVILNFWASWCYYCKEEMPDFEEIYKTYGEDIVFMMVNATDGVRETVDSAKKFIEGQGYTFPVYYDSKMEAAYAYQVGGLPVTFFIDAEGTLLAQAPGMASKDILQQGVDLLLPAE